LTSTFTLISVNPICAVLTRGQFSKEDPMKSRTIAVACVIAVLSFATAPVAAVAATTHQTKPSASRVDRSRDASSMGHVYRTSDRSSTDTSRDIRDR
jgi:hypothetical protein